MDESQSTKVHKLIQEGAKNVAVSDMSRELARDENINRLTFQHQAQIMSILRKAIEDDCSIEASQQEELINLAKRDTFIDFLAAVSLFTFRKDREAKAYSFILDYDAGSRKRVKNSGNTRDSIEGKADISKIIYKKSCEKLSQQKRLLKYEIIPQLVSKPDVALSEHDYVLLVAEGGAGKTSFLLDHWAKLLDSHATETKELPIYVPLNRFEGNDEFFIRNYIKEHYFSSQSDLRVDDWINNAKDYDIILLLDAINEAKNSRELGSEIKELCALGCKIILTSRHEMEGWGSLEDFMRVHLLPLSETIVDEQLKKHKLEVSERLRPFLTKPMYLALLLRVGEGAKEVESPGELLLAHHRWVQQTFGVDKHGVVYNAIGEKAFETVLPQIATVTDTVKFNGKNVKAVIEEYFADEGWDYREVLNLFVDAGIFVKERQTYFFSHEHYWDFYRAYGIYREMQDTIPSSLGHTSLSYAVAAFLGDLWREYKFKDKTDCNSEMSPIEKWMQQHLKNKADIAARQAVQNLFGCMRIARHNNIVGNYSGLDLTECCFWGDNIQNSVFDRSTVSVNCFLALDGHKSPPLEVAYASGRQVVASIARNERNVFLWNAVNGKLIQEITCPANVRHISISPNEEWLAVSLYDDSLSIFIFQMSQLPEIKLPHTRINLYSDLEGGVSNYTFTDFDNDGNEVADYEYAYPNVISFTPDSMSIVCGTAWGLLHRHDISTGKRCVPAYQVPRSGYSVCYGVSLDKSAIVTSSRNENCINIRDMYTFESIYSTQKDLLGVKNTICSNPTAINNHYLAVADGQNIAVFDTCHGENKSLSLPLRFKRTFIDSIFLSDSVILGSAGFGNVMRESFIINLSSNTTTVLPIRNPVCITTDLTANYAVVIDETCILYFIDLSRGVIERSLNIGHLDRPNPFNFDPVFPALITENNTLLRRTNQGEFILNNVSHPNFAVLDPQPTFISSPPDVVKMGEYWFDGKFLIAVEHWRMVRIWDIDLGKQVLSFSGSYRDVIKVSYVKEHQKVYIELEDSIEIVSVSKTGEVHKDVFFLCDLKQSKAEHIQRFYNGARCIACNEHLVSNDSTCPCIAYAFLPKYAFLVSGYENGALKVQSVLDAKKSYIENLSNCAIKEIHHIHDKSYVVVKDADGTLIVWDIITKECLAAWTKGTYPGNWFQSSKTRYIDFVSKPEESSKVFTINKLVNGNLLRLSSSKGYLVAIQADAENRLDEYKVYSKGNVFVIPNTNKSLLVYETLSGICLHEECGTFDRRYSDSICGWEVSPLGDKLVVTHCNGTICVIDISTKEGCEIPTCATNVKGCNFTKARFDSQRTRDILVFNGAIC